jgi:hypothetical protein
LPAGVVEPAIPLKAALDHAFEEPAPRFGGPGVVVVLAARDRRTLR